MKWIWKGVEDYKNDRLAYYQQLLKERGIIDEEKIRLLVGQLIVENGSLEATRLGDHGCSLGIPQYNSCAHHRIGALKFLKKHPEWNDWQFQMKWMAERTTLMYKKFDGNIRKTIIYHNNPACALRNCKDTNADYYEKIKRFSDYLTSP